MLVVVLLFDVFFVVFAVDYYHRISTVKIQMNSTITKMDSNLTSLWVSFFTAAGIPSDVSATYALTFAENRIQNDMLLDLNKEYLRDMGISRMGDVIAILRHAKQVHENAARDRVLSSTTSVNKVPIAAVAGRSTVTQPSSPASRILEHYTRNPQTKETSPVRLQKRKSNESETDGDSTMKKSRLIRFGTPPPTSTVKEVPSKQTVFSRLGSTEPVVAVASVKAVSVKAVQSQVKPEARPIFARLGSKSKDNPVIPVQKDALKYEGILKGAPTVKKTVTVTTTKNNIRKIACTMRADEAPVSVKEKLALPKNTSATKSVKFSNTVQYKEIEANKKFVSVKPKLTTVFNKPERRLSMPESTVKERLGSKKPNNLTITRNVFNRLGV